MATPIQLKHSSQEGRVPDAGVLTNGELAINTKDVKAYIKNSDGQVVQIAGADNPTTDGRYVKLEGDDVTAQEITGTAGLKTAGLLESASGVKLSGGDSGIGTGLYSTSGDSDLNVCATNNIIIEANNRIKTLSGIASAAWGGAWNATLSSEATIDYGGNLRFAAAVAVADADFNDVDVDSQFVAYAATKSNSTPNLNGPPIVKGFCATNAFRRHSTGLTYGFYGDLPTDAENNFNFYADADAPNFFKGNTYIGGDTVRNTLELWKSTLTEEQLEQYEAGALAIPETVSDPDNGFFARHWYYNQQNEETQALLDSGELKYPRQFAAETFTDTFELGVTTNINLNSNGLGEFKGGVKVTGGNLNAVNTGFYSTGDNVRVAAAEQNVGVFAENGVGLGGNTDSDSNVHITQQAFPDKTKRNGLQITKSGNGNGTGMIGANVVLSPDDNATADIKGLQVRPPLAAQGRTIGGEVYGYAADVNLSYFDGTADQNTFGFYSDLAENTNARNNWNFFANGSAPNYFKGIVESEGGVKLLGGSLPTDRSSGLFATYPADTTGSRLHLYATDANTGLPRVCFHSTGSRVGLNVVSNIQSYVQVGGDWSYSDSNSNNYALWIAPGTVKNTASTSIRLCSTRFPGNTKGLIRDIRHFHNHNTDSSISDVYGYWSSISKGADGVTNRYNFYAEGSAANYFAGKTYFNINADNENITGEANIYTKCSSSASDDSGIEIISTNSGSNAARKAIRFTKVDRTGAETTAEAGFIQVLQGVGAASGLQINGGTNGSVTWTSDYRLKSDIVSISSAADKIKQLNPVNYTIAGIPNVNGFIAHEVQEHVPQAVTGIKDETKAIGTLTDYDGTVLKTEVDEPEELTYEEKVEATPYVPPVEATYDEEGNELTPGTPEVDATYTTVTRTRSWTATGTRPVYQTLDQTKLIPLLTKALQEALERIEVLEAAAAG